MDLHRLLQDRSGDLKLAGLRRRVERMLFMTGVHKLVDVYSEDTEALAAFLAVPMPRGTQPSYAQAS